jgi:hypothetical protein
MAIKYPENTSYNVNGLSTNLPALVKAAQQSALARLQKGKLNVGNFRVGEPSPTADITPAETAASMGPLINTGQPLAAGFPTSGTTISQYKNLTNLPYNFTTPTTQYQNLGNYLQPSQITDQAKFQNMPATLGGGQYVTEPTAPGQAVISTRPNDWKEREIERQGLDPSLYQIDHLIPLWAGGADTLANKEVLDNAEHSIKTNIQSVPLTLLANGKISQREAMDMALTWRDKAQRDDLSYPEADASGMVPLSEAERIARAWSQTPGGLKGFTWKTFLESVPEAGQQIYQKGAEIAQSILPKSAATAVPREFVKGFVSAIPTYDVAMPQLDVHADYNDKSANTAGAVSHFLGALTGNLVAFGAVYKLALRGLAKAGVSWAAKELVPLTAEKLAAEAAAKLTPEVVARELTPDMTSKIASNMSRVSQYVQKTLPKAAVLGGVSAALGQASPISPDTSRAEKAAEDFAMGFFTPIGRAPYTLRGYASVAAPALTISLMEGLTPSNSFANAISMSLINAGTMVAMHGLGQAGQLRARAGLQPIGLETAPRDVVSPEGIDTYWTGDRTVTTAPAMPKRTTAADKASQTALVQRTAQNFASKWREVKYGELVNDLKTGVVKPADFGLTDAESIRYRKTTKEVELDRQNAVLDRYMKIKAEQNGWSNETLARERGKVLFSGRELYKGGLTKIARNKADLEDMITYAQKMKSPNPNAVTVPERMKFLEQNTPEAEKNAAPVYENTRLNPSSPVFNAEVPVTGISRKPNMTQMARVDASIKNGNTPSIKNGDGTYTIPGYISAEQYKNDPWARVYAFINGKLEDIGSIPKKERIEDNPDSFNRNTLVRMGLPADTPITDAVRRRYSMWDPANNNVKIIKEMNDHKAPVVKVNLVYSPEVKSALANGEHAVFFKAIINDHTWDGPSNQKMAENMVNKLNRPMGLPGVAAERINVALKNRPGAVKVPVRNIGQQKLPLLTDQKLKTVVDFVNKSPTPAPTVENRINDIVNFAKNPTVVEMPPAVKATQKAIQTKLPIEPVSKIVEENVSAPIVKLSEAVAEPVQKTNDNFANNLSTDLDTKTTKQILDESGTRSWGTYNSERVNRGIARYVDKSLGTMTPGTPEYNKIAAIKDNFNKDVIVKQAKSLMDKNKGLEAPSLAEFKANLSKQFTDNGLANPLEKRRIDRFVTKFFRDAAYSEPKQVLTQTDGRWVIEQESPVKRSNLQWQLSQWNKAHDTNLDILHFEMPKAEFGKPKIDLNTVYREMGNQGYIPLGVSGNEVKNVFAVKYDESLGKNPDEFIKNLFTQVMGFPEGTTADTVNKRAVLFNNYELPNPVQGEVYTHHVIIPPQNSLRSIGYTEADFANAIKNGVATKEGVQAALDKSFFDGKIYITKNAMKKILELGGYDGDRVRLKPTLDAKSLAGDKVLQKGDISILDDAHTKYFEDIIRKQPGMENFRISDNDVITFPDNVKVGLKDKTATYSTFQTPSDSYRFKYEYDPKPKAGLSLSILSKFVKADGLNDAFKELYGPKIKQYQDFIKELNKSVTADDGLAVFKKYDEFGKANLGEDLWGRVKKMVANGAWHKSVGKNIDEVVNRIFQEKVISGALFKGNHLFVTPDIGVKNGKFLLPNEIMVSRENWDNLGRPSHVLSMRYPVNKITNMTKAKVLVAEDYGIHNLGKEQIIPSHYDIIVNKDGDFDGDSLHLFSIGGKDGIPEKIVNKIEQVRQKEGVTLLDPLEPFEKTPLDYLGLKSLAEKAVQGGDTVSQTYSMARIMPFLADSGFTVGDMKAHWNSQDARFLAQLAQSGTDAVKSPYLSKLLKKENASNATDLIIKKLFTNVKTDTDIQKIKKAISKAKLQDPFNLANDAIPIKNNQALFDSINKYNSINSNAPTGPVQTIMGLLGDTEPYKFKFGTKITADVTAGENAVRDKFNSEYRSSNKVEGFIKDMKQKIADFYHRSPAYQDTNIKDFKQSLTDNYRELEPTLSPVEKRSIHMWLASSPDANIANRSRTTDGTARYKTSAWANKLDDVFNDSPDIAKTYYAALESYGIKPEDFSKVSEIINKQPEKNMAISNKYPNLKHGTIATAFGKKLKTTTLPSGEQWLEQNTRPGTRWGFLAKAGHDVQHLMKKGGGYAGKMKVDGKEYTYEEATKKFKS